MKRDGDIDLRICERLDKIFDNQMEAREKIARIEANQQNTKDMLEDMSLKLNEIQKTDMEQSKNIDSMIEKAFVMERSIQRLNETTEQHRDKLFELDKVISIIEINSNKSNENKKKILNFLRTVFLNKEIAIAFCFIIFFIIASYYGDSSLIANSINKYLQSLMSE